MRSRGVAILAFSLAGLLLAAGVVQAQPSDPTPAPRWLEVDYDVRITDDLRNLELDGTVDIHETETPSGAERSCGASCSADELRKLYQRSGDAGKQRIVDEIEQQVASSTEAVLSSIAGGGDASASADVDETSLEEPAEGTEFQPPIPVSVTGQATIGALEGTDYSADQLEALFEMGARVSMPVEADVPAGTNLTLTLTVPPPLAILGAGTDGQVLDERTARWTEDNWKGSASAQISDEATVGHPDVVVPGSEQMDIDVVLDLSQVDVHYLGALTGDTAATLNARLSLNATVTAMETPTELPGVELPYLSADAVRIAIANDLVGFDELISFEDQAREAIRGAFQATTGEPAPVSGGFQPDTLEASAVGDPPGTGPPIRLEMASEGDMPLPPEQPPGATAFEITRFEAGTIELPAIPIPGDRPATITILLPDGLDLAFDEVQGGEVQRTETDDGRTAITFQTSGDGSGATIQNAEIVVNHPVVWNLFWPVIVFLLVVLVVIPGVVILLVIRRRRREEAMHAPRSDDSPISGGQASQRQQQAAFGGQEQADRGEDSTPDGSSSE